MQLKPGARFRSVASSTEVIIVRCTDVDIELKCGGQAMVPAGTNVTIETIDDSGEQILPGKRYVDETLEVEVLCTKGGGGDLEYQGRRLRMRDVKPLPSSD